MSSNEVIIKSIGTQGSSEYHIALYHILGFMVSTIHNFWNIWWIHCTRVSIRHEPVDYNESKDNSYKCSDESRHKNKYYFIYYLWYIEFQTYSTMSAVTFQKYQLQLSLMWHQYIPREKNNFILEKLNDIHLLCSYAS